MREQQNIKINGPHPPHAQGTFHRWRQPLYTEKHKVSCSGFLSKIQPRATLMHLLQCVLQHHVANPHLFTHMATQHENIHADTTLRSATTDSKTPYIYAHTNAPKAASTHRYNAGTKKHQNERSALVAPTHTHKVPFIAGGSHFTRKNTRFRAPAFFPKSNPVQHSCIYYNAFCSITSLTRISSPTWQHNMKTFMQTLHCDLQPQIPKHPTSTHTQTHPKQLQPTVTMREPKNIKMNGPHPPPTQGTFDGRLQPLYTEKHKVSCSGFLSNSNHMQHSCIYYNATQCVLQHHVANPHLFTHMAPQHDNIHADTALRSATTDSKTPYIYAHTNAPKAASTHRYNARTKKHQNQRPTLVAPTHTHTRYLSSLAAAILHSKNTRFCAPASFQNPTPCDTHAASCSYYNAFCSITSLTRISSPTWQHNMKTFMQTLHCDLQPQIPKHPTTTHTNAPKAASTHRYNAGTKNIK